MINTGSDISSSTSKKSNPDELLLSRHIQMLLGKRRKQQNINYPISRICNFCFENWDL